MEWDEKADFAVLPPPQRRACPRYAVEGDCRLLLFRQGFSLPCSILDLGLGGCRIYTRERLPVGAGVHVEISFKVKAIAFRFIGVTRWTDSRHLAGIQFVEMSSRRQEELGKVLGEVEMAAASEARKKAANRQAAEAGGARGLQPGPKPPLAALAESPENSHLSRNTSPVHPRPEPARPPLTLIPQSSSGKPSNLPANAPAMPAANLSPMAKPLPEQPPPASPAPAPPKGPAPAKQERRSQIRHAVDTSATIFVVRGGKLTGRILDLSLSGCRIRTDERFPLGIYTRVETEFHLDGLPFRLGGVIQAIHSPFSVGVRFLDMSERKREQVSELIEEIEAQPDATGATADKDASASGSV